MKRNQCLSLCFVPLLAFFSAPELAQSKTAVKPHRQLASVNRQEVESLLKQEFGPQLTVAEMGSGTYVTGDFNNDGFKDLAVPVNFERDRSEVKSHGVKVIDLDPYSPHNGQQIEPAEIKMQNCLGLAIINGGAAGWKQPEAKFLSYQCFSSIKLHPKGRAVTAEKRSKRRLPRPVGDSMVLDLENGGMTLVYWSGTTFRAFPLRSGD
jgi:hypothetical protein